MMRRVASSAIRSRITPWRQRWMLVSPCVRLGKVVDAASLHATTYPLLMSLEGARKRGRIAWWEWTDLRLRGSKDASYARIGFVSKKCSTRDLLLGRNAADYLA